MNDKNKVIENKGANTIFYSIAGVILLCALYTIHSKTSKLVDGFGQSFTSTLLDMLKVGGGINFSHALLAFVLLVLILIFKIVIEKTSNIEGTAAKVGSIVAKKMLTLISNILLVLVFLWNAWIVLVPYIVYKTNTYTILGGNFVVDCIMIASLLVLIFIKKFN